MIPYSHGLMKLRRGKSMFFDDFALDVVDQGDVTCQHGKIVDVYHVPKLSGNMFFVA
jgi:hypothetical protein